MTPDLKNQVLRGNNLYQPSWSIFKGIVHLRFWRKIFRMIFLYNTIPNGIWRIVSGNNG